MDRDRQGLDIKETGILYPLVEVGCELIMFLISTVINFIKFILSKEK